MFKICVKCQTEKPDKDFSVKKVREAIIYTALCLDCKPKRKYHKSLNDDKMFNKLIKYLSKDF